MMLRSRLMNCDAAVSLEMLRSFLCHKKDGEKDPCRRGEDKPGIVETETW